MSEGVSRDDLRAAVASGVLDEVQASKLMILSDQRQGYRANMIGDDEPFELFKGFAEIFVTVGLGLLMSGLIGLTAIFGEVALIPAFAMVISVALAFYFTKKRRMSLPSIALCIAFASTLALTVVAAIIGKYGDMTPLKTVILGVVGIAGMLGYFRVFRLPFAMFALGVFGIITIVGAVDLMFPGSASNDAGLTDYFDLRRQPYLALGTLVFGVFAFVGALWFDLQDPHRVSRKSASAFWLHILAAPALVNTLVMSNYQAGGTVGTTLAIVVLALFTLLAIIIDRRSFLTAGLVYMGLLLASAINETGADWAPVLTMLVLGLFVTSLGAFWTQTRAWLLGLLPDFPGKHRLPPYEDGLAVSE
ncbi:hypothetical protein SAMN05444273_106143 [Litoreibacter ascidiaceicola]|uniref:DUF2157 domain-containing protein n=1 Tax=Litoreibacter ascidiaceicola TaxID=1486859 RepID=A0A1M5BTX1_9RHOB|nr:hypothetical protein [Litoreibacter ascidiaceicola]SHF46013.1 hypothetical protein SAMN05444273_106143 [Litoreibacter ascidiaceicola]